MNTSTVHFQLNEAVIHFQDAVAELGSGKMMRDDTPELAVQLGHGAGWLMCDVRQ
jgi:hypothetical protein